MRTFTLDQQRKNRKTVYNVQVIRNTAYRLSTQASYTIGSGTAIQNI